MCGKMQGIFITLIVNWYALYNCKINGITPITTYSSSPDSDNLLEVNIRFRFGPFFFRKYFVKSDDNYVKINQTKKT